jgi:hypothetical protein
MAGCVTEDGRGGISSDQISRMVNGYENSYCGYTDDYFTYHNRKKHAEVKKLEVPNGKLNRHRLNNMCMYDLLSHIQETLSLSNRCIIELITNEDHKCLNMNDTIQHRINIFAEGLMTNDFRYKHPKINVRIKVGEDKYDERLETDEEWNDRLCHMFMHQYHPTRYQMIKCEECIQRWLSDEKW